MIRYVFRRLAAGIVLLFVITTITFFLIYSSGADVARTILGETATREQVAAKSNELGLDRPITSRYASWMVHGLKGDFGQSWFTSEDVSHSIVTRMPVTLSLVILAVLIASVLATILAMVAATRRGWVDKGLQLFSVVGFAVPSFVVGVALITLLAIRVGALPATGYVPVGDGVVGWAKALVLPVLSLSIASVASVSNQLRSSLIEVRQRSYVNTLKTRGLGPYEILFRHVLRSASTPGLTVLSLQVVALMSGSVVVEQLFALPGIGTLAVNATAKGDLPVVMGIVVYTVIVVIVVNLVVDLLIGFLDPKVRRS